MPNYNKQASDFLESTGIQFSVVLIGSDCPKFCEDFRNRKDLDKISHYPRKSHIHGKHYRATFTRANVKPLVVDFWNSYADEEFNRLSLGKRTVKPYDVLACLTKSDPGTFEDFCSDFGMSTDSLRARETYETVTDEWRNVQRFFSATELETLQEIN